MKAPQAFIKARELVAQDPLPANVIDQLDELRKKIPGEYIEAFDQLYEAVMASGADSDIFS